MPFMYTLRDIVSGRRMHRNLVVGSTCNDLVGRLNRVGYSRNLILHAIEATYDFLDRSVYVPSIAKKANPRKISKESCEQIFDVLITTLLMEVSPSEDYRLHLAIAEFSSVSNNPGKLAEFSNSYEEALRKGKSPDSHAIDYISKQRLIPDLSRYPETQNAVLLAWTIRSKLYYRQMESHLTKMHEAINAALSDIFPPTQQAIIEEHRIRSAPDRRIDCDALIPLATLKSWSRKNCSDAASDPGQMRSKQFRFYYWSNHSATPESSVTPLPEEFLDLITNDLVDLLESKKAVAYCCDCKKYCNEPNLDVEEVGQDGAMTIVETRRLCNCGKRLWSEQSLMHLNLAT